MDFEKLYSDILSFDSSIRYAGVKIAGSFRSDVAPILSDKKLQMIHYLTALFWITSQRWQTKNIEHKIDPAKHALAEYDKIKRITFSVDKKHLDDNY